MVEHGVLVVVHQERHQRQRQRDTSGAPADRSRQAVPDRGRDGERDRRADHRVRTADQFEQRQQQQASGGGARQVVKIDAVHMLDGLADGQRDDRARSEERQRGGEVDQGQVPVGEIVSLRQQDGERQRSRAGCWLR